MRSQEQLPSKPPELIELTIPDFRQLDRSRYTANNLTAVCLAGAIIAHTRQQPAFTMTTPAILYRQGIITIADTRKLIALDHARSDLWSTMLATMGLTQGDTARGAEAPENLHARTLDEPNSRFHDWTSLAAHLDWLQVRAGRLQLHQL